MTKVGFIGLGTMGGGMAINMRKAGYDMIVHDIRKEAAARHLDMGCEWAENVFQVAQEADVIFTSLPGPKEVEQVALQDEGLLQGMSAGKAWCDLSTNSPTLIRRLAAQFAERGMSLLDTPVSGGPAGANSGKLAIWVGGDEEAFNKVKPMLDALGDQVKYIGPIGAGTVAKLVHNCAGYAMQAALAECFSMGVKAGVPPIPLWEAIRQGAGGRRRSFDRLDTYIEAKYDPPSFALRLAHKDVTLATQLGREVSVPMRIANLALEELTEAMNRGWADRDSRVAMLLQNERAGVEIKESHEDVERVLQQG
jgi:3-hydroxyisobutyrate dehydrogenase